MKKIVIFYPHIGEYGGIERNIIALANEIRDRDKLPVLLCFYDRINLSNYSEHPIDTIFIEDHWNPFVKSYRLRKWFLNNSNSILGLPFVFGTKAGFYAGLAFLSDYALHYTDPPSLLTQNQVTSFTNLFSRLRSKFSNSIIKLGVSRAKKCITMTKWNAIELEKIYQRSFEVVYQGGVPAEEGFEAEQKCINTKLTLFSICRLSTSKNLDWIIQSVKALMQTKVYTEFFTGIEVVIAGKGPDLERLQKITNDYKLQSKISFPGFLSDDELAFYYQNSDMFLAPGRQGFGLPILEALYRKLPVVMNVESRISEILHNNPWVCISENSSNSFSRALENHIINIRSNYPSPVCIIDLPTESKWATSIGLLCGWWDK